MSISATRSLCRARGRPGVSSRGAGSATRLVAGEPSRPADRARRAGGVHRHRHHRLAAINTAYELIERGCGPHERFSSGPPGPRSGSRRISDRAAPALRPDMLILHYTGMQTGASARSLALRSGQRGLLALSRPRGRAIVQMVPESDRAWHAGAAHGAAATTSTLARSASRSSIRATRYGYPTSSTPRSRR